MIVIMNFIMFVMVINFIVSTGVYYLSFKWSYLYSQVSGCLLKFLI